MPYKIIFVIAVLNFGSHLQRLIHNTGKFFTNIHNFGINIFHNGL